MNSLAGGASSDQDVRHRGKIETFRYDCNPQLPPNLYIREDLISFQAEFSDTVVSYDSIKLADKLQTIHSIHSASKTDENSVVWRLNHRLVSYWSSFFGYSSPVILAYSQYKSAGFPWAIGCLPPSLITVLSVRWLEVSPSAVAVDAISTLINLESDDGIIDPTLPDFDPAAILSPTEKSSDFVEWRRWPLTYVDPYPQWRVLALHVNQFVGIGYSNGAIEIINLSDANYLPIFIQQPCHSDFAPIVGMSFLQDSSYLVVCRFSGEIELWHLKDKSVGFSARLVSQKLHHSFIFSSVFDPENSLLAVGSEFVGTPRDHLTVLSIDNLSSFSVFVPPKTTVSGAGVPAASSKLRSLMRSISTRQNSNLADGFASLSLSPGGNRLAALHCSRAISVWSFPACSLLTTIISDAVAIDSLTVACKPLSPFLNSKIPVPHQLNWWSRNPTDPLLAILKSDGSLSVIDIETMENQLFNVDHNQDDESIQFSPFSSFAVASVINSTVTELFLLDSSMECPPLREKKVQRRSSSQRGYISALAAALGITGKSESENEVTEPQEEASSTFMRANVVRIVATSCRELFIHRLRCCRFSEARALTVNDNDGAELDPEFAWQYQMLALFHFPLKPITFEKIVAISTSKITKRVNWLLRACLHEIPCIDVSWKTVDLFRTAKSLLKAGLSRSSNANVTVMFQERLYQLKVLTAIYAEECALSLSNETGDDHAEDEVQKWCLELEAYRQNSPLDIALWYLQTQRYSAFGILVSHYFNILVPHLISLLSTVPATESPAKYLRLVRFFPSESMMEQPTMSRFSESRHKDATERLYSLLPKDFRWANTTPSIVNLAQWACTRAYELDRLSGLATEADELLTVVIEIIKDCNNDKSDAKWRRSKRRALALLQKYSDEVVQFTTILYRAAPGYSFSNTLRRKIDIGSQLVSLNRLKLVEFHQLTFEQRLELLICVCIAAPSKATAAEVCSVLTRHLLPFLTCHEKSSVESWLKQCLLRVAEYAATGLETVCMLVDRWRHSDVEVIASLEGISFESCIVDFLIEFTPPSTKDSEVYLTHVQRILSSLRAEKGDKGSLLYRLSECCEALLDYHSLVREMGYLVPPQGVPTSLGEALFISTGDESRLIQLVSRWIRATLVAEGEAIARKSQMQESSRGIPSSPLHAMKRFYFYNRLSSTSNDASTLPSENKDNNNETLMSIFHRLCTALTKLLGVNLNDRARFHLLVGVLCSGDRRLIDFAKTSLAQGQENDPTWRAALQYAIIVYFDATPAFGVGEVNEELGALCLSLLPSPGDSPESSFYGAVKFLSGVDRLNGRTSRLPSRSTWAKMLPERKVELFTVALQNLLNLTYMNEINLIQAGKYFELSEVGVNRCFLKAAIQVATMKSLCSAAVERTVALMQKILSAPVPSAWRELRLWSRAPVEILASLFPGVENSVVERFRLTLARFVITYSVHEAGCSEYAEICVEFAETCASQKLLALEAEHCSSMMQRLLSALSSFSHEPTMSENKPFQPCSFYLSPLDPTGLEDFFSSSPLSASMSAYLSSWSLAKLRTKTVQEVWTNDCLHAKSLDVGLSYAYGPPLGQKSRNWTKTLCTRLSEAIRVGATDNREMEDYRLVAASISASPQLASDSEEVFPPIQTLLESLARLSTKHPCIASWRSKALVSRLVSHPDKFFSDAAYRRNELLTISQTRPEVSLLLARHMEESGSQLILTNLSEIVFSTGDVDAEATKRRLKELSPYLKRDVPAIDLISYLQETVDPRVESIPLWRLLLLLKVILVIMGGQDAGLRLRGITIKKHIEFISTVIQLDTSVYFTFLSALSKVNEEDFLASVQPYLTSKSEVESLTFLIHQSDCRLAVSDAQVYATYATRLLTNSDWPTQDCSDCLGAMITHDGDASVLVEWISRSLFGAEAPGHLMDLEGRMQLVDSAFRVASTNLEHPSRTRRLNQLKRSSDNASVEKLKHFKAGLQGRIDWTRQFADRSFLSEPLQQRLLLHHFEDIETGPVLVLQAVREFLSATRGDAGETFSTLLSTFIDFTQRIAGLLYVDFKEILLKALCEGINEFLTTNVADWIYLDPLSQRDLENSDRVIVEFVKTKPVEQQGLVISLLLSWSAPRQFFGRVLLEVDPSCDSRRIIAQNAFNRVLVRYNLAYNSLDDVISKLIAFLQGHEAPADPIVWLLGDGELTNENLIQATAVAIELAGYCLTEKAEVVSQNESALWESWLECFGRHHTLPELSRQLVSRVHLARLPNVAYLTAVGALETDDTSLREAVNSCRLLLPPPTATTAAANLPADINLDPVACRRFLSRVGTWRTSEFPVSMLKAVLEVTEDARYDAFLRHILCEMRSSGDAWMEVVLIGRAHLSRKRRLTTLDEVLRAVEDLLSE
ncbi:neuroblastoma amplified sequence [Echinococcus multilocularis]|uniref:Neuroblastoma amplified sequence n=1 Tax=Echinococcus multilocularis TaxID=6211 RepID=A0A068Y3C8_ECHMU|nr:neuroblastoma amplified sequence [Echinococcus multilocularis]